METPAEKQLKLFGKIITGLELTYQRLIEFKKQKNSVLVVMKEGKVVKVKP